MESMCSGVEEGNTSYEEAVPRAARAELLYCVLHCVSVFKVLPRGRGAVLSPFVQVPAERDPDEERGRGDAGDGDRQGAPPEVRE